MINLYKIDERKFKSIYFSYNFTMPVNKKENSENALLSAVLAKSNSRFKTQKEIERYLNNLYGANFDVNIEKLGDLYNIEFRIECINKKYLPNEIDVLDDILEFFYGMIYEPDVKDSKFDDDLVEREKSFIIDRIKSRKDDKLTYAVNRTEELLCKNEAFGYYLYGDEDIVKDITSLDLYQRYLSVINNSCKTVIVSGNLEGYDNIEEKIKSKFGNKIESKISYSELSYNTNNEKRINDGIDEVSESQDTAQSVVTFGMRVKDISQNDFYVLNVYNAVLGSTPSSKLFQNFREKESLAYTVRSRYYRYKGVFVIYAGIKKENFDKSKEVIFKELKDIELGNISDEEFNASKESILSDLREWNDSKIALSKMLFSNLIACNGEVMTLDKIMSGISNVTKQDIIDIAKRINVETIYILGGEADV